MKFLQEVTVCKHDTANHLYITNDTKSRMHAYLPEGKTDIFTFKNPLPFYTKGRKFVEVKNTFGFKLQEVVQCDDCWDVVGSKGDVYVVERTGDSYVCSCSGFKFRSKCKHTELMKSKYEGSKK